MYLNKGVGVFPILLLAFILVPVIEIGLFIKVGGFLGFWPTIGLVLVTAFVGASLVRSQGIQTLISVQARIQQGELPAQQIFEGVLLAVAGVLLLTPGFLTDAIGMTILLPAPRAMVAKYLMTKVVLKPMGGGGFHSGYSNHGPSDGQSKQGNTFEGEYEYKKDDNDQNKLN